VTSNDGNTSNTGNINKLERKYQALLGLLKTKPRRGAASGVTEFSIF
jgi:hypothetical protein